MAGFIIFLSGLALGFWVGVLLARDDRAGPARRAPRSRAYDPRESHHWN